MTVTAFAPGHVTGFFEICPADDPMLAGSRGAGICLSRGAMATVERQNAKTTVSVDGVPGGPVTRDAIQRLTDRHIAAEITLQLPQSQGFGMSAAGTLAAAIAVAELCGLPREMAVRAAHVAEVRHATGLGDVVPAALGGIEIRETPGAAGAIRHIGGGDQVVVATVGPPMETSWVLHDAERAAMITRVGRRCMEKLLAEPSLERLFALSRRFARETGLLPAEVGRVLAAVEPHGRAAMCMLGNAVFAMGDTAALVDTLSRYGDVWVCDIDRRGARPLEK
ncbi:MAG: sugar kinase [Thermoplasmatota archaeon]